MNIQKFIRYLFLAVLGFALLYYTYQDISLEEFVKVGRTMKMRWVVLATLAHLVNHFLRAMRWRLFVDVQGYNVSHGAALVAEMSGFCMNLVPPRMGEWVRCVVLKRLTKVPISKSLGGVFVERLIDMFLFFCLVVLFLVMVLLGRTKFVLDLGSVWGGINKVVPNEMVLVGGVLALGGLGAIVYRWHREVVAAVWQHVKVFLNEVWGAMRAIRQSRSEVVWTMSLLILFFHFMVEYLSFYAIEEMDIDWVGALCVFIMMNLGMSAPTPGGVGVYHLGVISTLRALGVEERYAVFYATITHGVQLFNAFVIGGSCLLGASLVPKKRSKA